MENLKMMLITQLELMLNIYSPYQENLSECEKNDLQNFSQCLEILKKDKE